MKPTIKTEHELLRDLKSNGATRNRWLLVDEEIAFFEMLYDKFAYSSELRVYSKPAQDFQLLIFKHIEKLKRRGNESINNYSKNKST